MQEQDFEVLRNEANASPDRYTQWDPNRQFRAEYAERHRNEEHASAEEAAATPTTPAAKEEEAAPLSRHTTASSSSTSSSSNSDQSARLEQIRTARSRRETITSQNSNYYLTLHPTERDPEAIRRIETHRSQHATTVGTAPVPSRLTKTLSRRRTEKPLPSLGAGKPFPPPLPDREEYVVEFDGADDPLHAQNWPMKKKLILGAILAFDALSATMGSSIFSAATRAVAREFSVSSEVGTLGTSLFVFGYAFGPLVRTAPDLLPAISTNN
jgi:DHA1 family multidrug resistance protein-like MFS transporter